METPLLAQPAGGSVVYIVEAGASVAGSAAGLAFLGGIGRRTGIVQLGAAVEVIMTPGAANRQYYTDTSLGAENTCRNRPRGESVSDLVCRGVSAVPAVVGSLEVTPFRKLPFVVGAGYRLGRSYGPHAILALSGLQMNSRHDLRFVLTGGPDYWSARFGVMILEGPSGTRRK